MQHRLSRHLDLPVVCFRQASVLEGISISGDGIDPLSGVLMQQRHDMLRPQSLEGMTAPFYLSSFVKKFTYSGIIRARFFADTPINVHNWRHTGAERNEYSEPVVGGDEPLMAAVGGESERQNVDGRGLVFRRRGAASAAMYAQLEPGRPGPQLPIEEETYG